MKKRTPTMGGLFFVPIGVVVAKLIAGSSCPEVSGAAAATLAFGAIGLLDDIFILIKNHSSGLSGRLKLLLEVKLLHIISFRTLNVPCFMFYLLTVDTITLQCFPGCSWGLLFILVEYHKYRITLRRVYFLVTNLINF